MSRFGAHRRKVIVSAGVVVLLLLAASRWVHGEYHSAGPLAEARVVLVAKGSGLRQISRQLLDAGAISSSSIFVLVTRIKGDSRFLRAGEYRLGAGVSMAQIVEILKSDKVVLHPITIAEGLLSRKVAAILNDSDLLSGPPVSPPDEGTLLPDTYLVRRGDGRAETLARMTDDMTAYLEQAWPKRQPNLPFGTVKEAVILASIIEKETALAEERPHIAGVFTNRLRKNMRLQSDPTVIYGLIKAAGGEELLGRDLTRADLATAGPYNSYMDKGLTPTPICNPGRAAIDAALRPLKTDDLYFVASGDRDSEGRPTGSHNFAQTLAEHRKNVRKWRAKGSSLTR